jgi:hypothetical protein
MSAVAHVLVASLAGGAVGAGLHLLRIRRAGTSLRRRGRGALSARMLSGAFPHLTPRWRGFVATPDAGGLLLARYPVWARGSTVRLDAVRIEPARRPRRRSDWWGVGRQTVLHRVQVRGGELEIGVLRREEQDWLSRFPPAP